MRVAVIDTNVVASGLITAQLDTPTLVYSMAC